MKTFENIIFECTNTKCLQASFLAPNICVWALEKVHLDLVMWEHEINNYNPEDIDQYFSKRIVKNYF